MLFTVILTCQHLKYQQDGTLAIKSKDFHRGNEALRYVDLKDAKL